MRRNLLIAFTAVMLLINACTYEEGPISFRSKIGRLAKTWDQGVLDSEILTPSNMMVTLMLDKDGTGKQTVALTDTITGKVSEDVLDIKWKWGSSKEELILERIRAGVTQGEKKYRIILLDNMTLWLENESKYRELFTDIKLRGK